ncbi:MAG: hypothetical protein PCFJNLEI_02385 [Verrucomicrobiae bacterium]|nr:hypothetical protein [Verrucomicrobiae bacterium]
MNRNRMIRTAGNDTAVDPKPSHSSGNGSHGNNGHGEPKEHIVSTAATPKAAITGVGTTSPDVDPGAFISHSRAYWDRKEKRPVVELDRELILAAAENQSGEQVVTQHHTWKFNAIWAEAERVLTAVVHEMGINIRSGEAHIRELTQRLKNTNRYIEVERKTVPWAWWDLVQLIAVLAFGLSLLGVDVNSAAVTLMESGIEAFRNNWLRSALFNLSIIMGGAFVIKSVGNWLETDLARRRYAFTILSLAGLSIIVAVPVFAQTYSRLAVDPLISMTANETGSHGSNAAWTFALQLFVGNLVAGAMWLTAAQLVERHRPSVRAENPMWRQVRNDLDEQATAIREEHEKLGLSQGKLDIIAAMRSQLVTRAVEFYLVAAAECDHRRKMRAMMEKSQTK